MNISATQSAPSDCWDAIRADPELAGACAKLSIHEFRLIIGHATRLGHTPDASDDEVAEIERLASSNSVLHWAALLRLIARMRRAEAAIAKAVRS